MTKVLYQFSRHSVLDHLSLETSWQLCSMPVVTQSVTGINNRARSVFTTLVGGFWPTKASQQIRNADTIAEDEQLTTIRNAMNCSPKRAGVPALDAVTPINPAADMIDVSQHLRLSNSLLLIVFLEGS